MTASIVSRSEVFNPRRYTYRLPISPLRNLSSSLFSISSAQDTSIKRMCEKSRAVTECSGASRMCAISPSSSSPPLGRPLKMVCSAEKTKGDPAAIVRRSLHAASVISIALLRASGFSVL